MNDAQHTLTITLTEEEAVNLQALMREYGLSEPQDALKHLLRDGDAFESVLWDAKFAASADVLARMADEVHAAHLRGETEEITCDEDDE